MQCGPYFPLGADRAVGSSGPSLKAAKRLLGWALPLWPCKLSEPGLLPPALWPVRPRPWALKRSPSVRPPARPPLWMENPVRLGGRITADVASCVCPSMRVPLWPQVVHRFPPPGLPRSSKPLGHRTPSRPCPPVCWVVPLPARHLWRNRIVDHSVVRPSR